MKMSDKYLYSGNRQESAPRALFLDKRLTPLERNAWQVIKMMLEENGITAIPTYEQLQIYLSSMPLVDRASSETVARALTILRLTRWLSLVRKRRNKNGAILGNIYVLHDEPLSLYECLQIEPDYLTLLSNSLSHASKAIQRVAENTVNELVNDPYLLKKKLPTRLEILTERLSQLDVIKLSTSNESEAIPNDFIRNHFEHTSESEASLKPSNNNLISNPKILRSSNKNKILLQDTEKNLQLPDRFKRLSNTQQSYILSALSNLEIELQQQVLNEWQYRCDTQVIKQPLAYLNGIIKKAIQGELNLLCSKQSTKLIPTKPKQRDTEIKNGESKPIDREQARAFLDEIKKKFGKKRR